MADKINHQPAPQQARKIRVLFVITQSEIGGAQRFLAQLLSQLDLEVFEPVLAAGTDGKNELKGILPTGIPYRTLVSLKRNPSIVSDIKSLFELRDIFRELRPDIVFLNSSKAGFNGSFAASGWLGAVPQMTVLYRIGGWTFNDPWPKWKKIFYIILERISARWKHHIIVNCSKDLQDAKRLHIKPKEELLLIHNGIDPFTEFLSREQARSKIFERIGRARNRKNKEPNDAVLRGKTIIGTVANFYPPKGLEYLIHAAVHVRHNSIFVIIGDGALRPQLAEQIKTLGLQERVFLVGKFQHAYRYLAAFDVFVLPSVKEGFPWSVLEAMTAKVPVIATRVGALPEIIEHGKNGLLVQPGRPDQIVRALDAVLKDEQLRQELAIQAHQTIIRDFTLRQMVDKYETLFHAIINPKH